MLVKRLFAQKRIRNRAHILLGRLASQREMIDRWKLVRVDVLLDVAQVGTYSRVISIIGDYEALVDAGLRNTQLLRLVANFCKSNVLASFFEIFIYFPSYCKG